MYNPHFLEVYKMVDGICKRHAGEMDVASLNWDEIKDTEGNIIQLVPSFEVVFKG